jgi:hypothetical protein
VSIRSQLGLGILESTVHQGFGYFRSIQLRLGLLGEFTPAGVRASSFDPAGDRLLGEFGQLGLGLLGEYGPVGLGLFGSSWGSGSRESSVQLGLGLLESTVSGTGHGEPSG